MQLGMIGLGRMGANGTAAVEGRPSMRGVQ
jgi:6-phosphogluconate dehydrogenase (decarboxylating)